MKQILTIIMAALMFLFSGNADTQTVDSADLHQKSAGSSYIIISGTVLDPKPESFSLDLGEIIVKVKAGELKWYRDNFANIEGNRVTVYGKVDDELYETKTINAGSMYNKDMATFFFARSPAVDYDYWVVEDLIPGATVVRGTVTSIFGRKFTIDTGPRVLTVDTTTMSYNPLDDNAFQKLEEGHYVRIRGLMDYDFWQDRRLMADSIIILFEQ